MSTVGGSIQHVVDRIAERITSSQTCVLERSIRGLVRRMKDRRSSMPNTLWYREVRDGSTTVAYVCGQGCYISTVLSSDMHPRGTRI